MDDVDVEKPSDQDLSHLSWVQIIPEHRKVVYNDASKRRSLAFWFRYQPCRPLLTPLMLYESAIELFVSSPRCIWSEGRGSLQPANLTLKGRTNPFVADMVIATELSVITLIMLLWLATCAKSAFLF